MAQPEPDFVLVFKENLKRKLSFKKKGIIYLGTRVYGLCWIIFSYVYFGALFYFIDKHIMYSFTRSPARLVGLSPDPSPMNILNTWPM